MAQRLQGRVAVAVFLLDHGPEQPRQGVRPPHVLLLQKIDHPARLAEARRMVDLLEKEHVRWAHALAGLLRAMVEQEDGNRDAALKALRHGIALSLATQTLVFAVPAQYRLGELLGGNEGRETL